MDMLVRGGYIQPRIFTFHNNGFLPFVNALQWMRRDLGRLSGGLLGLLAAELRLMLGLGGTLGAADGRDALNSMAAEVSTVVGTGSLVGNRLVAPIVKEGCQRSRLILRPNVPWMQFEQLTSELTCGQTCYRRGWWKQCS